MTDSELLDLINTHCLSIRRIPLQVIIVYDGRHRDRHPGCEIFQRNIRKKIDGEWRTVQHDFIRVTTIPKYAGWWMCKRINNTSSVTNWKTNYDHLAPTLEESVQLFLNNIKAKDANSYDCAEHENDQKIRFIDI